jgi:hypothetical protein
MTKKVREEPMQEPKVYRAMREAMREGNERRRQYLASLDPRERELLAMGD